jgi:hypothetical protein
MSALVITINPSIINKFRLNVHTLKLLRSYGRASTQLESVNNSVNYLEGTILLKLCHISCFDPFTIQSIPVFIALFKVSGEI